MDDILIIGAGVAGMAAAEYLQRAGCSIRMVDKAARPGGRCATRRTAADPEAAWFDYGAQYFTARSSTFRASVERDLAAGRLTTWQPRINTAEAVGDSWLFSPSPDDRQRLIGPRGLNHWVRDRLAAADLSAVCDQRIEALQRDGRHWTATNAQGGSIRADKILLTAPAIQARTLLGTAARDIPVLADADRAMSACHSLVVTAPGIDSVDAIFFKAGRLSWAADNTVKAGHTTETADHLWTLHADAEFSDAHVEDTAEALAETMLADFTGATAIPRDAIEIVRAHRWRYARPGSGAPDPDQRLWVDPEAGLALAGDWLAGGRIEGAWLSGRGAAARLIGDV